MTFSLHSALCIIFSLAFSADTLAQQLIADETAAKSREDFLCNLPDWEDGLAEMSTYRAMDQLYGKKRSYTRVQIVNRQWMDPKTKVKAEKESAGAVPVFKLNIVEEIPTENYNYRYQTTAFLHRPDLTPMKMVLSSQEWCGTTFKYMDWNSEALNYQSFSYFPNEGNRDWQVEPAAVPYEALYLIARDVAARMQPRQLRVLRTVRSNHQVKPDVHSARLVPQSTAAITTKMGTFPTTRVDLVWDGPLTSFVVESNAPYRLLRYKTGPLQGELIHIEKRAYWNRDWPSSFYKPNEAP